MTHTPNLARIRNVKQGFAMVITDLHGDWDLYQRYRDRFLQLLHQDRAHTLILAGDLIHYTGPKTDRSLDMVLDVLRLQNELGDRLIYLLGNHEAPHLYNITLQKGDQLYTPSFEAALGAYRQQVLALFDSLPFYVRTPAGVTISHAGASPIFGDKNSAERLFSFSHKRILRETADSLNPTLRPALRQALSRSSRRPYDEMVRQFFAVNGPEDPRYDDFLIGAVATSSHPDFQLLWDALFNRNELQYGTEAYTLMLRTMLEALSKQYYRQRVLVSGHIDCPGGYKLVPEQQLRLASGRHALPRNTAVYLLFDVEKPVKTAVELLPRLGSIFQKDNR